MAETDEEEPEYEVIPVVQDRAVAAGEEVEIDVFFTGAGTVVGNQFDIFTSDLQLEADDPGGIEISIAIDDENNIVTGTDATNDLAIQTDFELSPTGVKFAFSNRFFSPKEETPENELLEMSVIEDTHDDMAPFSATLKTAGNAHPGDYDITFVFTYWSNDVIKKSRRDARIHVKTRREELAPLPTYAGISAAFIALVSLIESSNLLNSVLEAINRVPISRFLELLH